MNGAMMDGRPLRVNEAEERVQRWWRRWRRRLWRRWRRRLRRRRAAVVAAAAVAVAAAVGGGGGGGGRGGRWRPRRRSVLRRGRPTFQRRAPLPRGAAVLVPRLPCCGDRRLALEVPVDQYSVDARLIGRRGDLACLRGAEHELADGHRDQGREQRPEQDGELATPSLRPVPNASPATKIAIVKPMPATQPTTSTPRQRTPRGRAARPASPTGSTRPRSRAACPSSGRARPRAAAAVEPPRRGARRRGSRPRWRTRRAA